MSDLYPSFTQTAVVATAFKVLLWPAYKSTDFEVHRNWLAITNSLPVKDWYYEKTSEWTLDYPPFFAYFEGIMSQVARYVDPEMLVIKNLDYDSWQTVYFQRATVIATELVLLYSLHLFVKSSPPSLQKASHVAALSIFLSPGLLVIDHIHFQYNGFMYGVLILSIVLAREQSKLLLSGIVFAVLLCMKHIYLYIALAYAAYLGRAYCLSRNSFFPRFGNCFKLGISLVAIFAAAFGPFAYWRQLDQVISRLFPFSRGLCHAYWAPNVWAMYSFTDRVLIILAPYLKLSVNQEAVRSVTRGLVGDTSFAVLPDISPRVTASLTLAAQIPALLKVFFSPTWDDFVGAITLCGFASFLFGWHVHEKAILLVIIPFSLLAIKDRRYLGAFRPLAVSGHVSLFPLLFTTQEFPIKTVYTILWLILFLLAFERVAPAYDFLRQRKFTDAINGKSGMDFWAATMSENDSSSDIDKVFPDALRDPILRKVQFSQVPRIDELVTRVYDDFRNDFFPGEEVTVVMEEGEQMEGLVREKAKFPELRHPDGSIMRAAFSRYFVRLNDQPGHEALLDENHVRRNRNVFTKQNLRAFLKHSLQREAWTGAPWLVKEHLAVQYRLPMEIPPHLQQGARAAADRNSLSNQPRISGHFNSVKGRKGKNLTASDFTPEQLAMQQQSHPPSQGHYDLTAAVPTMEVVKPPLKFPTEDLDVPIKHDGSHRPRLKFLAPQDGSPCPETGLRMASVGNLLEIWNTLNVLAEIYYLDSFTFDEFFDAMKFSSPEITCELFEEIHCAVLKQLVDEDGEILCRLPEMPDDESEDENDVEDKMDSEPATPLDAPAHATRSRLSQVQNVADDVEMKDEAQQTHQAVEMLGETSWVERLQKRDFVDGGWQIITVGLLNQLSMDIRHKELCDKVLSELAPMDDEPTQETAKHRYSTLDINLRISALHEIVMLSLPTKAIRNYLEEISEEMTKIRKRKVEHQRKRKEHIAENNRLEQERRTANPDAEVDISMNNDTPTLTNGDVDDTLETNGASISDGDEDAPRSARRSGDRKRKREEELARKERERVEKLEAAKASNDKLRKYKKILKLMQDELAKVRECEDEIADCDKDLREANCARTKTLGRDRFWNRYIWFERNGMPFEGMPGSTASEYGYMNGRIWIQGPVDQEREGFIEVKDSERDDYIHEHQMTPAERKTKEEGPTSINRATEWGYLDDTDSLDQLIGWLDDRGNREKALHKELLMWREDIARSMEKRKETNDADKAKKEEDGDGQPVARISTRHKTYVDTSSSNERCLKWKNGYAMDKLGHIHCEDRRPKDKKSKSAPRREGKGVAVKVAQPKVASKPEPRSTRSTRSGK
ncbi:hypothetical protein MBLNU457_g2541t2 [Dothideomycetes sp. NU457]